MTETPFIDARSACAVLGVRPQTLYAYVSRGLIAVRSDPDDARRSLYAQQDVQGLAAKHRRPRARAEVAAQAIRWGEPVLETALSHVRDGTLWFGEARAIDCAETLTLEEIAARHCGVARFALPAGVDAPGRGLPAALSLLASKAAEAPPMPGRCPEDVAQDGARLLARLSVALAGAGSDGPLHQRLARAWDREASAGALRRALVLLSDHELNPSSFAVRTCASTGASLPAALLAGLCTLAGPRHGGVASLARGALEAALEGKAAAFAAAQTEPPYGFGYGHPLYPSGDPRARALLDSLPAGAPAAAAVARMAEHLDLSPNVDAGLAALAHAHDLPGGAAFAIFALGRCTGWIGHAIEQAQSGAPIRPRARYVPRET